jgi:DNA-binding MarR family transcriptional regulator
VTLNIRRTKSKATKATEASRTRRSLLRDVVDVLTAWNPREFIAAFQRWNQGQISLVHLNVLMLLEANGPTSMSRLAEALDISVASITGVVDRMETRGLVERRRDADDRRVILVSPAEGSRRLFADIDARRRAGLTALLRGLTEDELRGLLAGHRALHSARADVFRKAHVDEVTAMVERARKDRS